MIAWAAAWFSFGWLLGGLFISRLARNLADVRGLLARAEADLHHGWPESALDCIGRARRLLQTHEDNTHD